MDKVQIDTTQNVKIDYEIAGIGDRIFAALIDFLVLAGYAIGLIIFISFLPQDIRMGDVGVIALPVIIFLPYLFYDLVCEIFLEGQSIGKKAMKIKVAKLDGSQPRLGDYLLRWLLRFIDVSILSGAVAIFTIIINGKGQRLGDIAAGTTVVRLKSKVKIEDTILTNLKADYQPHFSQVSLLSDRDIAIIKKVLNTHIEDPKMANHAAYKTKKAIENKMGIKSDLMAETFLETVLQDYNAHVVKKLENGLY
jgi:uncharacterized RDD family membrane protein YckC